MKTFITTVGTSLLTNRNCPWAPWQRGEQLPNEGTVHDWLLRTVPAEACAEQNSWSKLGIYDRPQNCRIILLHTPTVDGRFCSAALERFALSQQVNVLSEEIAMLNPSNEGGFSRGLTQLARQIAVHLNNEMTSGAEVAIVATGGFKAETAMANMVGAVVGVPVHYVHEQFRQIVTIDPLPVRLDLTILQSGPGSRFLSHFNDNDKNQVRYSTIKSVLDADPRLETLVEQAEISGHDYIALNAMGLLALQQLRAPPVDWPSITERLPEEKVRMDAAAHHRPQGWEKCVATIAASAYVTAVRYEHVGGGGRRVEIIALDSDEAQIRVVHVDRDAHRIGFLVSTTARTPDQLKLVASHLKKRLNI